MKNIYFNYFVFLITVSLLANAPVVALDAGILDVIKCRISGSIYQHKKEELTPEALESEISDGYNHGVNYKIDVKGCQTALTKLFEQISSAEKPVKFSEEEDEEVRFFMKSAHTLYESYLEKEAHLTDSKDIIELSNRFGVLSQLVAKIFLNFVDIDEE